MFHEVERLLSRRLREIRNAKLRAGAGPKIVESCALAIAIIIGVIVIGATKHIDPLYTYLKGYGELARQRVTDMKKSEAPETRPFARGIYVVERATGQRAAMSKAGEDRSAVVSEQQACAKEQSIRSLEGTTSTAITFVNNTDNTISTYWIDYQGARKFYASVPPGSSYIQETYVTHPWVVTNSQEICLGVYMPGSSPTRVVIAR